MFPAAAPATRRTPCGHQPPCPTADAPDREAAKIVTRAHAQGWTALCNGVLIFEDTGELLPDGRAVEPRWVST
ncbi:DUF5999 family protein [Streptomyces sp. NPDC088387]|uniref:DUF5999 family protein n=1 Tax=Streptomyces sp. NPDC088387 TaxID=3365859 RepID=UPI0037FF60F8